MTTNAPSVELVPDWEQRPARHHHRDVTGVAVDSQDRVYLLTRFDSQVLVYDADGRFLHAWGHDIFHTAHGLTIGPDGWFSVILVMVTVRLYWSSGRVMTIFEGNEMLPYF